MKSFAKFWVLSCTCLPLLIGCGQKGDLYLPEDEIDKKDSVSIEPKTTKKNKQK